MAIFCMLRGTSLSTFQGFCVCWGRDHMGENRPVLGREFPVYQLGNGAKYPSHAMSWWATPYQKIFPLFQWALRTSAYVHRVICVPCCWMYAVCPKALKRGKNNHVTLDDWEKLTSPNECLALNPLFPKLLFPKWYFQVWRCANIVSLFDIVCCTGIPEEFEQDYLRLWIL